MNLNVFMQNGINDIAKTATRFYMKNEKGRAFMKTALPLIKKSAALRKKNAKVGRSIPPFLIASIASQCNLHCAGCYARAGGSCCEDGTAADLTAMEWAKIFAEAASLGTSFILLAGGEPLMRGDIIDEAAKTPDIIFPIFTNGTMLDDAYLAQFDQSRNLIPVLSIEGGAIETDARRGTGVHAAIEAAMARLNEKQILFGASITVTRENMHKVASQDFLAGLRTKGCGMVFLVEYVPAEQGTDALVLTAEDMALLQEKTQALKKAFADMILLSFPGDEAAMGGCLASGRGFFHINAKGGAEPCPFSPFAKYNLRDTSILEVLDSGYFGALREIAAEAGPHMGGCVLFSKENEVRALLAQEC